MDGACSTNGEERNAYRLLVGKPEGRRPLGRPRRRCLDNIGEQRNGYRLLVGKPEGRGTLGRPRRRWLDGRMDLVEVGWSDVDWIGLAQDRHRWRALVNSVLNLRVP
jgi:hypothetical protein